MMRASIVRGFQTAYIELRASSGAITMQALRSQAIQIDTDDVRVNGRRIGRHIEMDD